MEPAKGGLQTNPKKVIAISAAAMLLGGASWAIAHKIQDHTTRETGPDGDPVLPGEPAVSLPADIDVAGSVADTMSFKQAFRAAREEIGMGGVFNWHGRWYNTFEEEEWGGLSLGQRQEYTEMVLGEKLPVRPYQPVSVSDETPSADSEPTVIEGYLNGQRVMGLDFDQDGMIDTLVLDGADGNTYRIVDARGDAGLDTVYQFDPLDGELTAMIRLDESFVLSNDDFSQALENAMAAEIVDSILEPDATTPDDQPSLADAADESAYVAETRPPDEDTYINDGDVRDMDEE